VEKLEYWVYEIVKKFENMFTRFDTIRKRDGRMDRQMDTVQLAGQMFASFQSSGTSPSSIDHCRITVRGW